MRLLLLSVFIAIAPGLLFAADDDFKKGMKYYHAGNYAKAVKHLDAYLEDKPDSYAYYVKGYALYKMRRYSEAVADFKDAYMVEPGFKLKPAPKATPKKEPPPKETLPKETLPKETLKETPKPPEASKEAVK
jgi:tetratricopeptide (TPR) repeat protein